MRARPWRRGRARGQNVGGRETFDLVIVDESKGGRVRPSSSRLLLASEWENGLVVECAWCGGRFDWLICWQRAMSAGLWTMLAVTRDEDIDAECGLLTAAGRRSLQKTFLGGNRYDTGSQKHTTCSGIAGIGVVWCGA